MLKKYLAGLVFLLLLQTGSAFASCGLTQNTNLGYVGNVRVEKVPSYSSPNISSAECYQLISLSDRNGSDSEKDCYVGYRNPLPSSTSNIKVLASGNLLEQFLKKYYKSSITMYSGGNRYYTRVDKKVCFISKKFQIEVF